MRKQSEPESQEKTVRDNLKEMIPDYMIPTKIFFEDTLPKNANGKVDRRALKDIHFSESV